MDAQEGGCPCQDDRDATNPPTCTKAGAPARVSAGHADRTGLGWAASDARECVPAALCLERRLVLGGRGLLPVMRSRLGEGCAILLDDAQRPEERSVLSRWASEWGAKADYVKGATGEFAVVRCEGLRP